MRKLQRDVEALAGAYRLLTDPRDGPALLRDAATALNRDYRQVPYRVCVSGRYWLLVMVKASKCASQRLACR